MKGVSFRKSPMPRTQRDLCLEWIRACNRPHEQLNLEKITHYHYVCSKVSAWPNLIFPCWLLCSRLVDLESRSRSKEKSFGRDGLGGPGNPELFVTFWAPVAGLPTWPNCDQMWEIWPNGKSFDRMFFHAFPSLLLDLILWPENVYKKKQKIFQKLSPFFLSRVSVARDEKKNWYVGRENSM